jgi:uncharacterized short protein YbdD (DUF466 family)
MEIRRFAHKAWRALRHATGDDAYERYLDHFRKAHRHGDTPLTRREFCALELDRKWKGARRCC